MYITNVATPLPAREPTNYNYKENNMEDREEMLEAIMVIIESSSDEEVFHIFNTLTATVQ